MKDGNTSVTETSERIRSSAEELTEASIRRTLLSEAVQHPITLVSLGLAVLGLADFIAEELIDWGILGSGSWVLIIAGVIGALGSFFWIYSLRHDEEYEKLVQELLQRQNDESREMEQATTEQMREHLRSGLTAINAEPGLKALSELNLAYEQLQSVLTRPDDATSASAAHISNLAEQTYREGLKVLTNGLRLATAVHMSNREKLETEVKDLEKEIEYLLKEGAHERRLKIRQSTVKLQKDLLERINQQQYRLDELLYQSKTCEATLATTLIELTSLQAGNTEISVNAVTETLQRTIDQALEVQEEMRNLGF